MNNLDFAGIAIMIAGTATPVFFYGFYCPQVHFWRNFYLAQVWLTCIIAFTVAMLQCKYRETVLAIAFLVAGYSVLPGGIHLGYYADQRYVYEF